MTNEQQAILAGLANLLGINPNQPLQNAAPQQQQHSVGLPIGVYGRDHNGVFLANSVNELVSWDETVLAKDGGTNDGIKIFFCNMKEMKKSEKQFSDRQSYMARFEVMCPRGKNPINEVVNIFMKDKFSHIPYLDPRKWGVDEVTVNFRNIDDDAIRPFRLVVVTFDRQPISDDIHSKCRNLLKRLKGLWVYRVDGVEFDEEGPYSEEDPDSDTAK